MTRRYLLILAVAAGLLLPFASEALVTICTECNRRCTFVTSDGALICLNRPGGGCDVVGDGDCHALTVITK